MIERPGGSPSSYNGGGGANGGYAAHLTAEEPTEYRRAALAGRVSPYLGQHSSGSRQRSSRWENGIIAIGDGGAGKDAHDLIYFWFHRVV
jgi:hypothetical protein